MNIEQFFKSGISPTSTTQSNSSMVNTVPHCQNNMFHNPYYYQPAIHVPTRTTAVTIGEVAASVDMMRAQLTELSRRMNAMESKLSEFKHSVSNDIYLLKSTLSEHATELLNVRDCVEDTRTHVKKTNELIERQDNCVDHLADAVRRQSNCLYKKQHQQPKTVALKVDLGIIRRRLSRVEDFTNEFYEQFESFESVKEIITGLSDHIDECDQDISSFIVKKNEETIKNCSDGIAIDDATFMNNYFSNYEDEDEDDNVNNYSANRTNDGNGLVGKEDIYIYEDDDFEKL
jgi:hypothetical protein